MLLFRRMATSALSGTMSKAISDPLVEAVLVAASDHDLARSAAKRVYFRACEQARQDFGLAVAQALAEGARAVDLAAALGLTERRVYQLARAGRLVEFRRRRAVAAR